MNANFPREFCPGGFLFAGCIRQIEHFRHIFRHNNLKIRMSGGFQKTTTGTATAGRTIFMRLFTKKTLRKSAGQFERPATGSPINQNGIGQFIP
ncbi:hypothetical protein EVA_02763 [gut metagenome]|uniref:Uncharacterized protein n=1 Tax=gut metagenome TaxID=749906 RepID=J9GMD6_9ZZZZ